jgi:hypothetical protein
MHASINGCLEVVKWLLQNGATINHKVRDGNKMQDKERLMEIIMNLKK